MRKVLGASSGSIVNLLSGQFLKLILIASVIAMPVVWYGIAQWLNGFAFHIGMRWDFFVIPIVVLGLIAMATVSFQVLEGNFDKSSKGFERVRVGFVRFRLLVVSWRFAFGWLSPHTCSESKWLVTTPTMAQVKCASDNDIALCLAMTASVSGVRSQTSAPENR
ncbi:MAG: hypothetical protein QM734_06000 [Cyclobacteriaceae bacterium]